MIDESTRQPNILLLFPDQHRFDWLPDNPKLPLRMPNLQRMIDRGTRFTNAVTPSPLCAPTRACLASGRDYESCGVPSNDVDYPLTQPTYDQRLRDAGYQVGGVGKFDLHKATLDWGVDGSRLMDEWGFTHGLDNEGKRDAVSGGADVPAGPYMSMLRRAGLAGAHVADFGERRNAPLRAYTATHPTPLPVGAYCDNWIADNAVNVLSEFAEDRPWHLVVNFTGPHEPMDVTREMKLRWEGAAFPGPIDNDQLDHEKHQEIRRNYAAMLENIDSHIGRILELIEARGELDRTLVIYSSDHGEMLGDLNRWGKKTYYQPSVGVPLVVAGPGVAHATSDALVSLQDLTATFLARAGADDLPDMEGRSLWPLLQGDVMRHRAHVHSGLAGWRMVFDGRFKLVRGVPTADEYALFDLADDPDECHNLASERRADLHRLEPLFDASPWKTSNDIRTQS